MIVQNPANAFTFIHTETTSVACDPWITDGIYDGSWHVYPALRKAHVDLGWVDAVVVTHIHADHLDARALELTGEAQIILPDVYPNRAVCARRLVPAVQRRLSFRPISTPFQVGDLTLEFIPPMNRYGHLVDRYEEEDPELAAIDTGIIISDGSSKAVLLADNFPYHLTSAGDSLVRMVGCEALLFPYNACADDYPTCHDNLTPEEKRSKSLARNRQRLNLLIDAFLHLRPKVTVPYSSDFLLAGPRALEFIEVHPREFLDKRHAAVLFGAASGIPSRAMFEGDRLILGDGTFSVFREQARSDIDFRAEAERLLQLKLPTADHPPTSDESFRALFAEAAAHMLERAPLSSAWYLELECSDSGLLVSVDLLTRRWHEGPAGRDSNVLRCTAPSGYLASLLSFRTHWDNAMIGYHLSWRRSPDTYDVGLYKALNHLHVPLKAAA